MKQFRKICQGQVRVRVQGGQIGRFLTVLIARGILYENAAYEGAEFFLTLAARHYRQASVCAKKTNVRLRIVSKKGWPFFCFRHRRRKWTVLFVLPMMLAVLLLPRFIWTIEIDGIESISRMEILMRLDELGVYEGMSAKDLVTEDVKNELLIRYDDLSFVSLQLEGTHLKVLVEEAIAAPPMIECEKACDVVAAQDCTIYSIVTESGLPMVRAGDEVQAGDMLIKGQIVMKDDEGNESYTEVHAAGEIYGKRIWKAEEELNRDYEAKVWSGECKQGIEIHWGSKNVELRWPFGKKKQEAVIKEKKWYLPLGDKMAVYEVSYEGYTLEWKQYSNAELEQRLNEKLQRQATAELQETGGIALEEKWQFWETENGMKAVLEMVIMENVGREVK